MKIPDYPSKSYQHQAGYRTVPWDDWVGMRQRALDLANALSESIKLQSHYAELLNAYDGGERLTFTVAAIARKAIEQRDELATALRECADAINESIPEDFSRLSNAADQANAVLAKL